MSIQTSQSGRSQLVAKARELHHAGEFRQAMPLYRQLVRSDPKNPHLLYALGQVERLNGEFEPAMRSLKRSISIRPQAPEVLCEAAITCTHLGDRDEARRYLEKALSIRPGYFLAIHTQADLLRLEGDAEEARATLEPLIRQGDCPFMVIHLYAKLAPSAGRTDEAIQVLQQSIDSGTLAAQDVTHALFLLGELLDKAGRYDEAFATYQRANETRRRPFDPAIWHTVIDQIIGYWTPQRLSQLERANNQSELPVLIVGMPRSGTTLVEQIIASHPDAAGAGERTDLKAIADELANPTMQGFRAEDADQRLTAQTLTKAAWTYERALRKVGHRAKRITDKLPNNFLRLGMASLLFPKGRVIWCRRDAQDTCLSCYFHDFMSPHHYVYDLSHLGAYYREHERIMAHWQSATDLPILEVTYEQLVAEPEPRTRRLVEFCGLPWDEQCLHFHESARVAMTASNDQVRKPMYSSSIGRHQHYARHLAPLRSSLGLDE